MPSYLNITYTDYGGERSAVRLRGLTLDNVTYTFADYNTQMDALIAALNDVSIGRQYKTVRVSSEGIISPSPATTPYAQREMKWLMRYEDSSTGQTYTSEVPCADMVLLDANNPANMDKASAEYIALKAAFDDFVISPDGNACALGDVILVGRNL
jgi:hypothetical protein